MDATWIITAFVLIDTLLERLAQRSHKLAHVPDSEVLTVAVVAAKYVQNQHERALGVRRAAHSLSGRLDLTRFNRRLHALAAGLAFVATSLGEVFLRGDGFVSDSIPVPVGRRGRARRCRTVRGREYCGDGAAQKAQFFGGRLHLICTPEGIPVRFTLLPAAFHDRTPVHELADVLPPGARLFGAKAFNSADDAASILAETKVRLIPIRKANMQPHEWFLDELELRE